MPLARIVQFPAARTFLPQPSRRTNLFAIVSQLEPAEIELLNGVAAQLLKGHVREGER